MKSLCGPSGVKLVTLKKLVFLLSPLPESVATPYFKISRPVLVACNSGCAVKRPTIVIFANELRFAALVEKRRALGRALAVRRARNDILILRLRGSGFEEVEVCGW